MRVTTLQTASNMLDYITAAQTKYNELSEEASSGIKVSKPSDDPMATKSILSINSQLSALENYLTNMDTAQSELDTVDSTLSSLTDLIEDVSGYATQAANGTYNTDDLATIKSQIDSIMQTVVNLANTSFNGSYVFSGTAIATETYSVTTDADGVITSATYNGTTSDEYERYVTISDGVSVAINVRGNDIFGSYTASSVGPPPTPATGSGLLYTLGILSEALGTDPQTTTTAATISSCITDLDDELSTVTATRTKLSAVSNRFSITQDSIDNMVTNLKSYRSNLQDADLAEVATNLATAQSALEATYSVTSQMLSGVSLLDYL